MNGVHALIVPNNSSKPGTWYNYDIMLLRKSTRAEKTIYEMDNTTASEQDTPQTSRSLPLYVSGVLRPYGREQSSA